MEKMTVEQLVAKLQKCNQKAIVITATSNFEQGNSDIPANGVREYKGKIVSETFRDAFDGECYDKEVAMFSFDNEETGTIDFVKIY